MIVRKLLKLQADIEDRNVPCDMHDDELNPHYSESKGVFKNIFEMDVIHLLRSYHTTFSPRELSPNQHVYVCITALDKKLS